MDRMQSKHGRGLKNLGELTSRERMVLRMIRQGSLGDVLSILTSSAGGSRKVALAASEAAVVSKS